MAGGGPFNRGYAPTGLAPDGYYGVDAVARDVRDLHRALRGDDRAVLVGHDWGAIAAYGVAAVEPGLFGRIATLAVPPIAAIEQALRRADGWGLALRQARHSWYIGLNQVPGLSERIFDPLARRLWAAWSPGYDAADDLDRLAAALPTRQRRAAAIAYYRHTVQPWRATSARAADRYAWRRTPATPTLYLHGSRDGCLLPAFADAARDLLPDGSEVHVVEQAGHFLQLEQPSAVADRVLSFVSSR